MNQIDLTGRIAVVTGAGQGIGLAITRRLVQSGATVSMWDRDPRSLEEAATELSIAGNAHAETVDVTDPHSVERGMAAVEGKFGRIDILVANAGIAGSNHTTWAYPLSEWSRVIDVNLNGVFHCCRSALPFMLRQNYGRIVNVASIAGKEGNPNASAYSASKAGVIALTKSIGKETAQTNISVNCITPSAARTAIFEQMSKEHIDYMLSKIPRARFVEVEEIAAMVCWLVSEENSFTTGAIFDVSGGRATY